MLTLMEINKEKCLWVLDKESDSVERTKVGPKFDRDEYEEDLSEIGERVEAWKQTWLVGL